MDKKETINYLQTFIPKELMKWVKKQMEITEQYNKKYGQIYKQQ